LTALLQNNAVRAAPQGLEAAVTATALAGAGGSLVPPALEIANTTAMAMAWTKLRWFVILLLLTFLGLGPMMVDGLIDRPAHVPPPREAPPIDFHPRT
jgi:hypothetical protein